jgi:hypothetical protein
MKPVKKFYIETANARFTLTVSARDDGKGFVGEYYGTAPKFAQAGGGRSAAPTMREFGSGKLGNVDLAKVIAACRAEIEKLDGSIERTTEGKV